MERERVEIDRHDAGTWGRALAGFGAATGVAVAVAGRSGRNGTSRWYRRLKKPPFQPPTAAFPIVWTALYAAMAASAASVWRHPSSPERARALRWWWAQLGLNAAWTPLFFGLHRIRAALVDLLLLEAALVRYTAASWRIDRGASMLMFPQVAWVAFAGVLNGEIARRNP